MKNYVEEEDQDDDCAFTREDFKDLARSYLKSFFKSKIEEDDIEIDVEDLLTERNVSMVLNFDIRRGIPLIYNSLKQTKEIKKRKGKIPGDIQFILNLLSRCAKMSVPKCFATGLIAVYFEMYKDCKIKT